MMCFPSVHTSYGPAYLPCCCGIGISTPRSHLWSDTYVQDCSIWRSGLSHAHLRAPIFWWRGKKTREEGFPSYQLHTAGPRDITELSVAGAEADGVSRWFGTPLYQIWYLRMCGEVRYRWGWLTVTVIWYPWRFGTPLSSPSYYNSYS